MVLKHEMRDIGLGVGLLAIAAFLMFGRGRASRMAYQVDPATGATSLQPVGNLGLPNASYDPSRDTARPAYTVRPATNLLDWTLPPGAPIDPGLSINASHACSGGC